MLTLTGGLTIVLDLDREATYTEMENALNGEGFFSGAMAHLLVRPVRRGRVGRRRCATAHGMMMA